MIEQFRPLDERWRDHPVVGRALRRMPSVCVEAVADVDRTQIRLLAALSASERLDALTRMVQDIEQLRAAR